ncbi:MAG TPA: hypothetical protein DCZ91_18915 [Lachnospiraceae bacterium]|nr:hypothetical protein [Lachnospiraceae bacterium]
MCEGFFHAGAWAGRAYAVHNPGVLGRIFVKAVLSFRAGEKGEEGALWKKKTAEIAIYRG